MTLSSIEVLGGEVTLSVDEESAVAVEIVLHGTDMQYVNSVEFDSGEGVSWVVSSISAGATSVQVTAYAFGSEPGTGFIGATVGNDTAFLEDIGFAFPLMD